MTVKSNVKAGGIIRNHNERLVVRSDVKGGGGGLNHSETMR